jgi:hypothetical protein
VLLRASVIVRKWGVEELEQDEDDEYEDKEEEARSV